MSPGIALGAMIVILVIALFSGSMVSLAMGLVAIIAMAFFLGGVPAVSAIGPSLWSTSFSFTLTAVPLFLLMGHFISESRVSRFLFDALIIFFRRLPGGIMLSVLMGGGILGAATGSCVADTATIGAVAYPEMSRRGYNRGMAAAAIAAGGTVGILMPPSINMIVYGGLTMTSVGHLFMGGVLPAILMVALLMIAASIRVSLNPSLAPSVTETTYRPLKENVITLVRVIPLGLLIVSVLGSIYGGIATPTEVGAVGALGALILSLVYRGFSLKMMREALRSTLVITSFIIFIVCASTLIMYPVTYLNIIIILTQKIAASGLSPHLIIGVIYFTLILLGCILETLSLTVLMVPVLFPVVVSMGFDPIWFGVMFTICSQIGNITPPVGMCLYTVKGIARGDVSIMEIAKAAFPFMIAQVATLVICTAFPQIVLWLPKTMLTR